MPNQIPTPRPFWGRFLASLLYITAAAALLLFQDLLRAQSTPGAARILGTVSAVAEGQIIVKTDGGEDVTVALPGGLPVSMVSPGARDLSAARQATAAEIRPGDRLLVRGSVVAGAVLAESVVLMPAVEIAGRHQQERDDWRARGTFGVVEAVDVPAARLRLRTRAGGETQTLTVQTTDRTIIKRYPPGSIRYADCLPGKLDQIRPGDQLRVLGDRSPAGDGIQAEQLVFGTFRTSAGRIEAVDTAADEIRLKDGASGKLIVVRIRPNSQLKKFSFPRPPFLAAGGPPSPGRTAIGPAPQAGPATGARDGGMRRPDVTSLVERLPAATLADLRVGDTVLVSSAAGAQSDELTAIVLVAGAEPLLNMLAAGSGNGRTGASSGPSLAGLGGGGGLEGMMAMPSF